MGTTILWFCQMEAYTVIRDLRVWVHQQSTDVQRQERVIKNRRAQKPFYHDTIYDYDHINIA